MLFKSSVFAKRDMQTGGVVWGGRIHQLVGEIEYTASFHSLTKNVYRGKINPAWVGSFW